MINLFLNIQLFFILLMSNVNPIPKPIALWKDIPTMKKEKSFLYFYPAPDSIQTGVSVIICPGGSYSHLMGIDVEGFEVAEWLNRQGINAFVLRYRVGMYGYHHPAMIQDIQRAIQYVRDNSEHFNVQKDKLGVMGFSAGGHLVTMAGAFYQDNYLKPLGIDSKVSLRPDFVVPVYPVVSMQDSIAHARSKKNLLTKHYTKEQQDRFSMELQMSANMPPTFLVTAKDDPVVNYINSVELSQALLKNNVPYRFLLYETGGHGYGMNDSRGGEAAQWRFEFIKWLNTMFYL